MQGVLKKETDATTEKMFTIPSGGFVTQVVKNFTVNTI